MNKQPAKKKIPLLLLLLPALIILFPAKVQATSQCQAATSSELTYCINQFNDGLVKTVEITQKINCTENNFCRYTLTTTQGGLIFGTPGSNAGFYRSGDFAKGAFGAPIFAFNGAANITISNLQFTDDQNSPNQPYCTVSPGHDCGLSDWPTNPGVLNFVNNPLTFSLITIDNSNTITLNQIKLVDSKREGILSKNSNNITVKNSQIEHSYLRGMKIVKGDTFLFEGNYFFNNNGAGIRTDDVTNFVARNNTFIDNQTHTPWNIGGGQINLQCNNATVTDNIFKFVTIPVAYLNYGGSIELHTRNENLTIQRNKFINKVGETIIGPAIYNDPNADASNTTPSTYNNVLIENNIMDTGTDTTNRSAIYDWNQFNSWTLGKNCYSGISTGINTCSLQASGAISAAPTSCYIRSGSTSCSTTLSWATNNASNIAVKVGNNVISNQESGTYVMNNVSTLPTTVYVSSNGIILDSINVAGADFSSDLNENGAADIFDYNVLISNFGKPYNIFDYNRFLSDIVATMNPT